MSIVEPVVQIPVGVVVERRTAKSTWTKFVWRPLAILPGVPNTPLWTELEASDDRIIVYAGAADITLFRSETGGYQDNLRNETPALWVALRPTADTEHPYAVGAVTADPGEGESFNDAPGSLVDAVPMPHPIQEVIARFVAEHHVDRPYIKRQRDDANFKAVAALVRTLNEKP
jgi:hypothetical protein